MTPADPSAARGADAPGAEGADATEAVGADAVVVDGAGAEGAEAAGAEGAPGADGAGAEGAGAAGAEDMDAAGAAAALVVGADSVTGAPGAVPAAELPVPDAVAARFADDPVLEVVLREAIATGDEPGHLPPTIAIVDADQDFVDAARMLGAVDVRAFSDSTVAPLDGAVASGLDAPLLAGASLVVGRLPKSLAELAALADAVARLAEPGVRLILGARQQHLVRAMNDELGRSFAHVRASRGMRKSRALVASGPEPGDPPLRTGRIPELDLQVRALGGAFAGAALDLGTRVLLEAIDPAMRAASRVRHDPAGLWNPAAEPRVVLDLGSGTGVLAAWAKRRWPRARVIATDRSWFACESTRATASANGLDIETVRADAADAIADASVDLVLCNPPFHDGRGVDRGMANRLFDAAGRVLRPGGDMVTVFNSHLRHREQLQRRVGHTRQLLRTPKFTVTLSERR